MYRICFWLAGEILTTGAVVVSSRRGKNAFYCNMYKMEKKAKKTKKKE